MADTHYEVDETKYHARQLMEPVRRLKTDLDRLQAVFDAMNQMKDGDGSDASHFQKVVDLYGANPNDADNADKLAMAKAIHDEMNSALGNLHASLPQLLNRLG